MLAWLASFLSGPLINGLISAYKAKLDSVNTTDAHALELAKADLLAQIEARKQATILAGNTWINVAQAAFVWLCFIYTGKIVVYDVMLGLGTTEPIRGAVAVWLGMAMSFAFGGAIISGVVSTVARRFGR